MLPCHQWDEMHLVLELVDCRVALVSQLGRQVVVVVVVKPDL